MLLVSDPEFYLSGPATTPSTPNLTRKRTREDDQNADQPPAATASPNPLAIKRARFGPPEDSSSTLEYPTIASLSTAISPIRKRPRSVDGDDDEEEEQDELSELDDDEIAEVEQSISYSAPPRHTRGHKRLRKSSERDEVSLVPYGSEDSSSSGGDGSRGSNNSNEREGSEGAGESTSESSNASGSAHSSPRATANATVNATSTNASLPTPTSDVGYSSEPSSPTNSQPCLALELYTGTQSDAVVHVGGGNLESAGGGPSRERSSTPPSPVGPPLRRSEQLIRRDADGEPIAYTPELLPGIRRPIEYGYWY